MDITIFFSIIILVFSVIIHEVAHGYSALWMGDPTAKYAGRLTMNPIKHIDPIGSIILPLILAILPGSFMVGWAKPVPYNAYNLRNQRWGELVVAIAGPISNIVLAIIFGLLIRFSSSIGLSSSFSDLALYVVLINIVLAIFNMVPIPPLDGSKVLFAFFPEKALQIRNFLERAGLFFVIFFIFFLWQFLTPVIYFLVHLITGLNF